MHYFIKSSVMQNYEAQVRRYLELSNYSPQTIKTYLSCLRSALSVIPGPAEEWSEEAIGDYLLYMRQSGKSTSSINQAHGVLKIFRIHVLGESWSVSKLPRARQRQGLPVVLSVEEVRAILATVSNVKHRAILELLYTSGIRLSELRHLKLHDIDSRRMQIRVEQGKGQKDRYTLLSEKTLHLLREYYKAYRPSTWLFESYRPGHPYSRRSVQVIFQRAKERARIQKPASVHTLRHSFATHLLDTGVDVLTVRDLLGHKSLATTMRYLRLRRNKLSGKAHPLDAML